MPGRLEDIVKDDVRIIERKLKHGLLSQAELDKYYASLPDVSHKAEILDEDGRPIPVADAPDEGQAKEKKGTKSSSSKGTKKTTKSKKK